MKARTTSDYKPPEFLVKLIPFLIVAYLATVIALFSYQPRIPSWTAPVHVVKALPSDPRIAQLDAFFAKHNCPKPYYSNEYIKAADGNHIPFALLPSISVVESSCGRHYRYSNFWGWNSAKTGFASVTEGIDYVSAQLGSGHYYAGKSIEAKLRTYNSVNPLYAGKVESLMNSIIK